MDNMSSGDVDKLWSKIDDIKSEIADIKDDVAEAKSDTAVIKNDLDWIKDKVGGICSSFKAQKKECGKRFSDIEEEQSYGIGVKQTILALIGSGAAASLLTFMFTKMF